MKSTANTISLERKSRYSDWLTHSHARCSCYPALVLRSKGRTLLQLIKQYSTTRERGLYSVSKFDRLSPLLLARFLAVESVVFCRPSLLQLSLYRHLLTSRAVRSCLTSFSFGGSRHLVCIGALKKLCNDPSLIYSQCQEAKEIADSLDMDEVSIVCHFRALSLTFGCLYCSSLKRGIKRTRCRGSFAL